MTAAHLELGRRHELRLLAMVPQEAQRRIRRLMAPIDVGVDFISRASEVSHLVLSQTSYQVALLPATLPDSGWWSLWGEIALLHPRPEILVYAHAASFELWSGVLEAGGYDVLVEPFSGDELQRAVIRAAISFAERLSQESSHG
ncbi:MAG TPA: hypothetical protein VMB49_08425 [Acidobacteriaceae bacterium]|nr:hypothetical protein [Acidobacteriaceae bacterium]